MYKLGDTFKDKQHNAIFKIISRNSSKDIYIIQGIKNGVVVEQRKYFKFKIDSLINSGIWEKVN